MSKRLLSVTLSPLHRLQNPAGIIETIEIKLTNQKNHPVHVLIKEHPFRAAKWEITKSSEKWQKHNARTIHIPVEVPTGGEKVLTYTVKYTW